MDGYRLSLAFIALGFTVTVADPAVQYPQEPDQLHAFMLVSSSKEHVVYNTLCHSVITQDERFVCRLGDETAFVFCKLPIDSEGRRCDDTIFAELQDLVALRDGDGLKTVRFYSTGIYGVKCNTPFGELGCAGFITTWVDESKGDYCNFNQMAYLSYISSDLSEYVISFTTRIGLKTTLDDLISVMTFMTKFRPYGIFQLICDLKVIFLKHGGVLISGTTGIKRALRFDQACNENDSRVFEVKGGLNTMISTFELRELGVHRP